MSLASICQQFQLLSRLAAERSVSQGLINFVHNVVQEHGRCSEFVFRVMVFCFPDPLRTKTPLSKNSSQNLSQILHDPPGTLPGSFIDTLLEYLIMLRLFCWSNNFVKNVIQDHHHSPPTTCRPIVRPASPNATNPQPETIPKSRPPNLSPPKTKASKKISEFYGDNGGAHAGFTSDNTKL